MNIKKISALDEAEDKQDVSIAGMVAAVKKIRTKGKNEPMAYLTLEDDEGSVDVIVFPELYNSMGEVLKKDAPLLVRGALDRTDKGIKIVARELSGLEDMPVRTNGVKAEISINDGGSLRPLKDLLEGYPGTMPVYLLIRANGSEALIQTSLAVSPDDALVEKVDGLLGKGSFRIL
jgi:DNA polymerase-3 subunit alpha